MVNFVYRCPGSQEGAMAEGRAIEQDAGELELRLEMERHAGQIGDGQPVLDRTLTRRAHAGGRTIHLSDDSGLTIGSLMVIDPHTPWQEAFVVAAFGCCVGVLQLQHDHAAGCVVRVAGPAGSVAFAGATAMAAHFRWMTLFHNPDMVASYPTVRKDTHPGGDRAAQALETGRSGAPPPEAGSGACMVLPLLPLRAGRDDTAVVASCSERPKATDTAVDQAAGGEQTGAAGACLQIALVAGGHSGSDFYVASTGERGSVWDRAGLRTGDQLMCVGTWAGGKQAAVGAGAPSPVAALLANSTPGQGVVAGLAGSRAVLMCVRRWQDQDARASMHQEQEPPAAAAAPVTKHAASAASGSKRGLPNPAAAADEGASSAGGAAGASRRRKFTSAAKAAALESAEEERRADELLAGDESPSPTHLSWAERKARRSTPGAAWDGRVWRQPGADDCAWVTAAAERDGPECDRVPEKTRCTADTEEDEQEEARALQAVGCESALLAKQAESARAAQADAAADEAGTLGGTTGGQEPPGMGGHLRGHNSGYAVVGGVHRLFVMVPDAGETDFSGAAASVALAGGKLTADYINGEPFITRYPRDPRWENYSSITADPTTGRDDGILLRYEAASASLSSYTSDDKGHTKELPHIASGVSWGGAEECAAGSGRYGWRTVRVREHWICLPVMLAACSSLSLGQKAHPIRDQGQMRAGKWGFSWVAAGKEVTPGSEAGLFPLLLLPPCGLAGRPFKARQGEEGGAGAGGKGRAAQGGGMDEGEGSSGEEETEVHRRALFEISAATSTAAAAAEDHFHRGRKGGASLAGPLPSAAQLRAQSNGSTLAQQWELQQKSRRAAAAAVVAVRVARNAAWHAIDYARAAQNAAAGAAGTRAQIKAQWALAGSESGLAARSAFEGQQARRGLFEALVSASGACGGDMLQMSERPAVVAACGVVISLPGFYALLREVAAHPTAALLTPSEMFPADRPCESRALHARALGSHRGTGAGSVLPFAAAPRTLEPVMRGMFTAVAGGPAMRGLMQTCLCEGRALASAALAQYEAQCTTPAD
jgi:hypothetical protein